MRLSESVVLLLTALLASTATLYPFRDAITLKSLITLAMVGAAILAVSLLLVLAWVLLIRILACVRGRLKRQA